MLRLTARARGLRLDENERRLYDLVNLLGKRGLRRHGREGLGHRGTHVTRGQRTRAGEERLVDHERDKRGRHARAKKRHTQSTSTIALTEDSQACPPQLQLRRCLLG